MADVADVVPPAIDQSGNTVIWWVPTIATLNAVKASTEIGAATSSRVTHSFTPDGFPLSSKQEKTDDPRLALPTALQSLGVVTVDFGDGVTYVDSSAAGSAAVVLAPVAPATTVSGYFVVRRNISNATLATTGQKCTVYPVTLGPQMRGPLTGSGKFTFQQQVVLTGIPVESVMAA